MSLHYLVKYECQKTEICVVLNDKSQDSTAKHSSSGALLHYKFAIQFAGEKNFFKLVNTWRSYKQNG